MHSAPGLEEEEMVDSKTQDRLKTVLNIKHNSVGFLPKRETMSMYLHGKASFFKRTQSPSSFEQTVL